MNRQILQLALPNIVTNITVPLLGMVDMAIVGHLSGAHVSAIVVGSSIFNLIYWNFGFLRMGTSGLTAQAFGAERWNESLKILVQACTIALIIAGLVIALQWPIAEASKIIFRSDPSNGPGVMDLALTYFFVRVWAAPATLGLYSIKGWFIGMQDSKTPMWIAIVLNCINILASLLLVMVLHWDIFGVALGTVIANYSGLALGIIFLRRRLRRDPNLASVIKPTYQHINVSTYQRIKESLRWQDMRRFFKVNSDVFLRTVCLSAVFTFITAASGRISENIRATDGSLMMFFTLFSYIMDGFAYAGESLVGRYVGARQKRHLKLAVRLLILWGLALTVVFTGLYAAFGNQFLHVFTDKPEVIATAGEYMTWVLVIPLCGCAAFLFDGIFIGATATRTMRNAMFVATGAFFAVYYGLKQLSTLNSQLPTQQWNNILWLSFMVFLTLRGLLQFVRVRKDIYGKIES